MNPKFTATTQLQIHVIPENRLDVELRQQSTSKAFNPAGFNFLRGGNSASRVEALLVTVTTFLLFSSASSSIGINPFSSYGAFLSFAIVHTNKNGEDD
jgi:hypothetical protein